MTTTFTSWKPILPASLRSIPALPPSLPLRLTRLQLRLRPSPRLWPHGLARRAPARHCTGLPGPANGTNWHGPARPVLSRARPGSARPGSSRPESTLLRLLSRVLCVRVGGAAASRGSGISSLTGFTPHARLASQGAACCRADLGRTVSRAAAAQHAGSRPCSASPTQRLCSPAGRAAGAEAEQARCGGVGPGGSSRKVAVGGI
jgi:hypothetical protein